MKSKDDLREEVKEEWNSTAAGWRKWDPLIMKWLKPVGEKILELAAIREGDVLLDVATGSGEPGLSAARIVGSGKVVGLDISEEMVRTAREKAGRLGMANYEARTYDGNRFPLDSDNFDAVISRFGIMFFPDVGSGLGEMVRVLKPGRRLCVAVWGPQNETAKRVMQTMNERLGLPEESPDSPNPFRFAEPGKLAMLLRDAGLRDVTSVNVPTSRTLASTSQYWEYLLDMNQMFREAYGKANGAAQENMRGSVGEVLDSVKQPDGRVLLNSIAYVSHGTK